MTAKYFPESSKFNAGYATGIQPMTEKQLQHFRQILEKQLKESMLMFDLIGRSINRKKDVLQEDEKDKATRSDDFKQLLQQADQERKRVGEIHQALNRMTCGRYGICVACKRQISLSRLEIFPTARFCLECTQLLEQEEKNREWTRASTT